MADLLASHPVTRRLAHGFHGAKTAAPIAIREVTLAGATVIAGRGLAATVATKAGSVFGTTPVDGATRTEVGDIAFLGIGPGRWLALSPGEGEVLVERLEAALTPEASIVDQSGGQVVFEVSGATTPEMAAKILSLDLDLAVFPVGSVATTIADHVGITLWRIAPDAFGFVVGRSYAGAFERALATAAAEFGFTLD